MFRQLIGSDAGSPDSFSVPFPGGAVSLSKPKQLFVLSASHIITPPMTHIGIGKQDPVHRADTRDVPGALIHPGIHRHIR